MLFNEFDAVKNNRPLDNNFLVENFNGNCAVNGLFASPIIAAKNYFQDAVTPIFLPDSSIEIGYIYQSAQTKIDMNSIGEIQLAAYLAEASSEEYALPYSMHRDYVVIKTNHFTEYEQHYKSSSMVWGGFSHASNPIVEQAIVDKVFAHKEIDIPTIYHQEILVRAISQNSCFERFLKKYHLLELLFDLDVVDDIKNLGSDLNGIGTLLSRYDRSELKRFEYVIEKRINDRALIVEKFKNVILQDDWSDAVKRIFFDFGKTDDPMRDHQENFLNIIKTKTIGPQEFIRNGLIASKHTGTEAQLKFEGYAIKIICFWIYRIRCSIAHSRIGEYVMRPEDLKFVSKVAEPILDAVILQAFRKTP